MNIRKYNPADGQAFQGDVSIIPMPAGIAIGTTEEISPIKGRLILQEGEVSGHHHAINLMQRHFQAQPRETGDPLLATRSPRLRKALGGAAKTKPGVARMYRDDSAVAGMLRSGLITRADLVIGCLIIEGAPMLLSHEEHDAIELPPGKYLIGRQVESAGAEERVVAD